MVRNKVSRLSYHRAQDRAIQWSHAKRTLLKPQQYFSARVILCLYTIFHNENGSLLRYHHLKGFSEEKHSKPQTFCLHTQEFNKPQVLINMLWGEFCNDKVDTSIYIEGSKTKKYLNFLSEEIITIIIEPEIGF